jgi:hypothetical protein
MSPKKKNASAPLTEDMVANDLVESSLESSVVEIETAAVSEAGPQGDAEIPTEQSSSFIGQWNQLISTTNWEKGQIIVAWRQEMAARDMSPTAYSDETWSRLVGGVSPQHVGRLRRTFERFGAVYQSYANVYWSHFYAALDWDDAEMWLEGAVQNRWPVSQMRTQRWEANGGDPLARPASAEIVVSELDEELSSLSLTDNANAKPANANSKFDEYVPGPRDERPDFGEDPGNAEVDAEGRVSITSENRAAGVALFAAFEDLPDDVNDAAEDFKLCIIRHKADEWNEISQDNMLALLDALKQLATTE